MKRRDFMGLAAAAAIMPKRANANEYCTPATPWQPGMCRAEIDLSHLTYTPQSMSQWCWAACNQIIFGYYGYSVRQEDIVRRIYGSTVNLPAMSTRTITNTLNGIWVDDEGYRFRCSVRGLYDYYNQINTLDNNALIQAMRDNTPMYFCNATHACVLSRVVYQPTPYGPYVTNLGLIDPWPTQGFRGASSAEMVGAHQGGAITYLAIPYVEEI